MPASKNTSLAFWLGGTVTGWAFGFIPAMVLITGVTCCSGDGGRNMMARACVTLMFFGMLLLFASIVVTLGQAKAMQSALGSYEHRWIVLSCVGITLGWVLGWLASVLIPDLGENMTAVAWIVRGAIIGSVIGFLAGVFQVVVLRRLSTVSGWWIVYSILGWTCASALYWLVYWLAGGPFEPVYTYYEGSNWPKSAEASGAAMAMLIAWVAGGLVLSGITGGGMLASLRRRGGQTALRETNAVSD